MKNVLLINAHQKTAMSLGEYNATLMQKSREILEKNYRIKTTVLEEGYEPQEEVEKMLWADYVIFQFPVYWMDVPYSFKQYLDEGLSSSYGKLYANDGRVNNGKYGSGGLANSKKYMFSTTWNAPESAFNDKQQFFEGKSVDDVFFHLHKAFQFLGMRPLKTFNCYDIMSSPDINRDLKRLEVHLSEEF